MGNREYLEQLKRKLPQTALNALKLKPTLRVRKTHPNEGNAFYVRYEEYEPFSDFFFEILEYTDFRNIACFKCRLKPASQGNPNESSPVIPLTALAKQFKNWEDLVKAYHTTDTVFDDPVVEAHYEEYSRLLPMELVGPEAEKPFVGKMAVLLLEHCDALVAEVESQVEDSPDRAKFIADVRALQDDLTSVPRGVVFERLYRIWAKISAESPRIMKFINDNVASWGLHRGLDGVMTAIDKF
jgi:hypothetical protein